jgi:carbonic anhydrase
MYKKDNMILNLIDKNKKYQKNFKNDFKNHIKGQSPKIAILTCADSRVIPEQIFQASIGEIFVVRVAGNIAVDKTIIESLEYAVDHLKVTHLIILAHTFCGAVKAAEESKNNDSVLLNEIKKSFSDKEKNNILSNLNRQLSFLPKRSKIINKAIEDESLKLVGCIYYIEDGHVEFL